MSDGGSKGSGVKVVEGWFTGRRMLASDFNHVQFNFHRDSLVIQSFSIERR
jgi:hypothetical protein